MNLNFSLFYLLEIKILVRVGEAVITGRFFYILCTVGYKEFSEGTQALRLYTVGGSC